MRCMSLALVLSLGTATGPLHAADAPDTQPTLHLGTIEVRGAAQIVAALRVIKIALRTPFSDDPAHADDPVCRIQKQLGETREYLDCATNRDFRRRREATQVAITVGSIGVPDGADIFRAFIAKQPEHHLHLPVNGGNLQALLARIPDDATLVAPAASAPAPKAVPAVTPAPASATSQPGIQRR